MLNEEVMQDLLSSALRKLETEPHVGLSGEAFHRTTPDLPWGEAEARAAAAFIRERGRPARAVRLHFDPGPDHPRELTVTEHFLFVARTEVDLAAAMRTLHEGTESAGRGTFTELDEVPT